MLVLISERTVWFKDLAVRLNTHGIFLYICPYETAEFFCEKKDTGGVFLDCAPSLADGEAMCAKLHATYPDMPIAALIPQNSIPDLFATRLIRECNKEQIFEELLDFCIGSCGWSTETLSTYALTIGNDPAKTRYMGYPLPLTARQHVILRCLFYRSPDVTSTDDLMELCYPEGVQHINNLAVQIHNINLAAAKIDPRPLIVNVFNTGYRLRDGIV